MLLPLYICIPAYKETELVSTLESLASCSIPSVLVHIYSFINASKEDTSEVKLINKNTFEKVKDWIKSYRGELVFEVFIDQNISPKNAGVGYARRVLGNKVFESSNGKGVLSYLDADCTVAPNYLVALESYFNETQKEAAAIHFEHPITNPEKQGAIIAYELHLRYYIAMQEWLKLPFAFHTVGSSMAVRLDTYHKRGGMNKKKAGEDFYFLQKYCKAQTIGKITNTTVYPSSRISDRVPFGTGRAMQALENGAKKEWLTYNPRSFEILSELAVDIPSFYQNELTIESYHIGLQQFLEQIDFIEKIEKLKSNAKTRDAFIKNFYQFFDAFQLMKYLHFMRDEYNISDVSLAKATAWYASNVLRSAPFEGLREALQFFRERDKLK